MVSYCDAIVIEIKSARTEIGLKNIIDKSLLQYRNTKQNIHNEEKYILNMIVTLKYEASAKDIAANILKNLQVATEIFSIYRFTSYGKSVK
jgi:hypothetical protein